MVMVVPPGAPNAKNGFPSFDRIVGHIAVKRALPGARLPTRPGLGSNTIMQLLYMKPSPSVITPELDPSECVTLTTLPAASATTRCVVSLLSSAPEFSLLISAFSPARIFAANSAARALLASRSCGTSMKFGSPINWSLSIVAYFMASATVAIYCAELCPMADKSKCSRIFSISKIIRPPPGN